MYSKTFILCKPCERITQHQQTEERGRVQCVICGAVRWYAKDFGAGDFPELTEEENETIHEARVCGFGVSYPAYPTAESQARSTLAGAKKWLETHSVED
jgi:hypothetical protein